MTITVTCEVHCRDPVSGSLERSSESGGELSRLTPLDNPRRRPAVFYIIHLPPTDDPPPRAGSQVHAIIGPGDDTGDVMSR